MDPLPQHRLLRTDPLENPDRDLTTTEQDPWGADEFPNEPTVPASTDEIRELVLKSQKAGAGTAAAADPVQPFANKLKTMAAQLRTSIAARWPPDRRVFAALGAVVAAGVLLVGVASFPVGPSIRTLSGTTYNGAVAALASAVDAARDLVGAARESGMTTAEATTSPAKPATGRSAGKSDPIALSHPLQVMPLVRRDAVHANTPAPLDDAAIDAAVAAASADVAATTDASIDTSIVYSSDDPNVTPPVGIRAPGIATDDTDEDRTVSMIEILVSETGRVESARGRQRPTTLGAALQSTTALSVVKTWRFLPARLNGRPVKYRTVVPFIETPSVARH